MKDGQASRAVFTILVYTGEPDEDDEDAELQFGTDMDELGTMLKTSAHAFVDRLRENGRDIEVFVGDEYEDTTYPPKLVYRPTSEI